LSATLEQLKELTNVIATVASTLQSKPTRFAFANQNIGLPMDATMTRDSVTIPAENWPSVEKIMQTLERLHQQRAALQTEWSTLGRSEQEALKSPDDLLGQQRPTRGW